MAGKTILYRGSLKSCNYHCTYCPFSKHKSSQQELEKDKIQWYSFIKALEENTASLDIGALMVAPYGEALLYPWYWEGLAYISSLSEIDAVGAQTNLSFPVQTSLSGFRQAGGKTEKLRFWGTFHPQMISVSRFAESCRELEEAGIRLSIGAVGVPENIELIRELRRKLPEGTYMWINKMDGLRRPYSQKEREAFLEIDPYFERELTVFPADTGKCTERLFAEGDGKLRTCNISPVLETGWEELCKNRDRFPAPVCSRKYCFCYLAYGGGSDFMNQALFGPHPLFRIPRRPKAAFFDIMGTLVTKEGIISSVVAGLFALSREGTCLFFATTLPYRDAVKRCGEIRHMFRGGIFAGGAHILLQDTEKKREWYYFLDESCTEALEGLKKSFKFRILLCKKDEKIYKVTLLRPSRRPWSSTEAKAVFSFLPPSCRNGMRYIIEENCLQIVSAKADKAGGVRTICQWLGISPKETFAAGDSKEDAEMTKLCGG